MTIEKHFTISQVGKALNVSSRTVRRWIGSGKIKAVELPGAETGKQAIIRIPASELEKLGVKLTPDLDESG